MLNPILISLPDNKVGFVLGNYLHTRLIAPTGFKKKYFSVQLCLDPFKEIFNI